MNPANVHLYEIEYESTIDVGGAPAPELLFIAATDLDIALQGFRNNHPHEKITAVVERYPIHVITLSAVRATMAPSAIMSAVENKEPPK